MKITEIELLTTHMTTSWLTEKVIANPMSIYPEYFEKRTSWYGTLSAGVVVITVENGTQGLGFVGIGKATVAGPMLDKQIRDLALGKNCFDTELIQEQLFRASISYGQGGVAQALISGIYIALWDLKGKLLQQPVYDLLGGATLPCLRPYLTTWDAGALEKFGVRDVKLAMPYGPAHGEEGTRANLQAIEEAQEVIGPDAWVSLDCYMAWDVPYTIEMARRLQGSQVKWIEEPVMPEDVTGYRRIKESVHCMVSGGEHPFTLEGFRHLIEEGRIDLVQPDIYRAGGPTNLKKIGAIAKANGCQLMCHGIGLATFHYMISNGPEVSPRCEFLDTYDSADTPWLFKGEPRPSDGKLVLEDTLGFGYWLDDAAFAPGAKVAPIW